MQLIFVIDLIYCKLAALISSNSLWIFYILNMSLLHLLSFFLFFLSSSNYPGKKPSSTMLSRNGESRYPFVTDPREKTFNLFPLTMGYL